MPRITINGKSYDADDFEGPNSMVTTDEAGNTTHIVAGNGSIVADGDIHASSIDMGR